MLKSVRLTVVVVALMVAFASSDRPLSAQTRWSEDYAEGVNAFKRGDLVVAKKKLLEARDNREAPRKRIYKQVPYIDDSYMRSKVPFVNEQFGDFYPEYFLSIIAAEEGRYQDVLTYTDQVARIFAPTDPESEELVKVRAFAQNYIRFEREQPEFIKLIDESQRLSQQGRFDDARGRLHQAAELNIDAAIVRMQGSAVDLREHSVQTMRMVTAALGASDCDGARSLFSDLEALDSRNPLVNESTRAQIAHCTEHARHDSTAADREPKVVDSVALPQPLGRPAWHPSAGGGENLRRSGNTPSSSPAGLNARSSGTVGPQPPIAVTPMPTTLWFSTAVRNRVFVGGAVVLGAIVVVVGVSIGRHRSRLFARFVARTRRAFSDPPTSSRIAASGNRASVQIHNSYGDVTVITGAAQANQLVNNIDWLKAAVRDEGVATDDVAAMERAIREDDRIGTRPHTGLGPSVLQWLKVMAAKAAAGVWGIAVKTVEEVLPKLLLAYYGLQTW